jgi:hypothetical protein
MNLTAEALDKIYLEPISLAELEAELRREAQVRRKVYPGWIDRGKLTAKVAARRIAMIDCALSLIKQAHAQEMSRQPQQIDLFPGNGDGGATTGALQAPSA